SGVVLVEGRPTSEWDPIRLRRRTGYVIQEGGLFPHFTVERNVGLVPTLENWDGTKIKERVNELLSLVGLDAARFADRYPRELSGGQKQRVGVARALAAEPPLLLLDEPFGALDPLTRASLQREFGELAGRLRKSAIFVTHDVREALLLGSRIGLMQAGRLLLLETPENFLKSTEPYARAYLETFSLAKDRSIAEAER
ncbi:MAG: ATP-binding cassette domain-containing protein, partial [Pyrinomonadaceae bacterium]